MNWYKQLTRMRRFLRDPDGNLWSDSMLLRLYNESQREWQAQFSFLEDVQTIRVPALFQFSHLQEWEWAFSQADQGYVYRAFSYYDPADIVTTATWEAEEIAQATVDTQDEGANFSHPWEAWAGEVVSEMPPVWAPEKFNRVIFLAWDKDPLIPEIRKGVTSQDPSFATRTGIPQYYWRSEKIENSLILYPLPSSVAWGDITAQDGSVWDHDGMVLWEDEEVNYLLDEDGNALLDETGVEIEDENQPSDWGAIVDETDALVGTAIDFGVTTDKRGWSDNLLMVYSIVPRDLDGSPDDESDIPAFLRKYLEYFVLERAYAAEGDGQIESLRKYWQYRRDMARQAVEIYQGKRRSDRDYQLRSHDIPARVAHRQPRLPDHYPAM